MQLPIDVSLPERKRHRTSVTKGVNCLLGVLLKG